MNLWIDIETIPKPMEEWELLEVIEKGRSKVLKDPAKIAEADEETVAKLGLHPAKFRMCAFGLAADAPLNFSVSDFSGLYGWFSSGGQDWASAGHCLSFAGDERALVRLLSRILLNLRAPMIDWGGHNIASFDLPRLQLAFARTPGVTQFFRRLPKPWEIYDTCAQTRASLDDLAIEILGAPYLASRKSGLGKNMGEAVAEGRWHEIAEYCARDADLSRLVGKKMFGI